MPEMVGWTALSGDVEPIGKREGWGHPGVAVCDGGCRPQPNGRELWHDRDPVPVVFSRHRDSVSGLPFRDDLIDADGAQHPGQVAWRLRVNDETVEASLEEMERFFSDQLSAVRSTMDELAERMPRQRGA